MNKKVLTLCAGFLLAGGMLSSVSAETLEQAAGTGKYYKMVRVAYSTTEGSWTEQAAYLGTKIDDEGKDQFGVSNNSVTDYWKVEGDATNGYTLTNLDGQVLEVGPAVAFFENLVEVNGTKYTQLQLVGTSTSYVGVDADAIVGADFWKLAVRPVKQYDVQATVFDADPTSLEKVAEYVNYQQVAYSLATDKETTFKFVVGSSTIEDGNIYKATYDKDNNSFSFIDNETGAALLIGGEKDFVVVTCEDGAYLQLPSEGKYVAYADGAFKLVDSLEEATLFGFQETTTVNVTVKMLNYFEKDGFSVTITCDENEEGDWDYDDLKGNPFTGHLTPMTWNGTSFEVASEYASQFYLRNADGNYIVATQWDGEGADRYQALYGFTTVSASTLEHNLERAAAGLEEQIYFGEYSAYVSESQVDADVKGLKELDRMYVWIPSSEGWSVADLGRYDFSGTPTLVASTSTSLKEIRIDLGSDKVVEVKDFILNGKFVTVVRKNVSDDSKLREGYVVADDMQTTTNNNAIAIVSSYGNPLEGQWAVTYDGTNYKFTNRENTNVYFTLHAGSLYVTDADRVYRQGDFTYEIKGVAEHAATDGYKRLTDLKNTKYHIAFSSAVFENNAYFTENHEGVNNHTVGLDTDVDNALTFTATEYSAPRNLKDEQPNHSYNYVPTDSIYVISYLGKIKDGKYDGTTADTLKVVSYSFVNQWNEPLIYNSIADKYQSQVYKAGTTTRFANVDEAQEVAQKFALREDGEKLNLRLVDFVNEAVNEKVYDNEPMYQEFAPIYNEYGAIVTEKNYNSYCKVYAGDAANGILDNVDLYERTENDLFVVEETEKPMYRRVVSPLDTVSIFRDGNNQSVLFESKGFLGMENLSQFPNIAPGMIADTAYIGNGDTTYYRPQYLLAVDAIQHGPTTWCPDHGYGATCQHAIDIKGYLEGRFLVNLKDTAIAWDEANKHKDGNPYINSENYYRLGFVEATHRNDSLIIAEDNNRIYVGDENYNVAKFAFRYVDDAAGSFVIETADYVTLPNAKAGEMKATYGYLKWMNNVVVVVDDIKDADVYNMNEAFEGNPTANEEISANAAVSVVATDGAVIVKGAAGKNVVVSTILGKVVANEVLNSDNETIAAPAGIVVVSVDGESFKVAVK